MKFGNLLFQQSSNFSDKWSNNFCLWVKSVDTPNIFEQLDDLVLEVILSVLSKFFI